MASKSLNRFPRTREYGPVFQHECGASVYYRIDRRGAAADHWLLDERTGGWHRCSLRLQPIEDLNIYEQAPAPPVPATAKDVAPQPAAQPEPASKPPSKPMFRTVD